MKQLFFAATIRLAGSGNGFAADFNTAFGEETPVGPPGGLLAGGIASIYAGYLGYEQGQVDISDPDQGIVGARGAYSLPLTSRFSAQFDLLGEVNVIGSNGDLPYIHRCS